MKMMVNINTSTALLLFFLNHLQVWTSPMLGGGTKPCLLRDHKSQTVKQPRVLRKVNKFLVAFPNTKIGPKKTKHYNPNYGYEPYWDNGTWVFDPIDEKSGDMCGAKCNPVYKKYGPVCGRDKNYKHETFANYCELRNKDCSGFQRLLIAYRGECQKDLKTNPTAAKMVVTRAMQWLSSFSAKYYVKPRG